MAEQLYFGADAGLDAGFFGPIAYGLFVISVLGAFRPSSEVAAALGGVTPPPSIRASLFSPQPESPSKITDVVPSITLRIVDFMMFQGLLRVNGEAGDRHRYPREFRYAHGLSDAQSAIEPLVRDKSEPVRTGAHSNSFD
jgi:hypothetical protein